MAIVQITGVEAGKFDDRNWFDESPWTATAAAVASLEGKAREGSIRFGINFAQTSCAQPRRAPQLGEGWVAYLTVDRGRPWVSAAYPIATMQDRDPHVARFVNGKITPPASAPP